MTQGIRDLQPLRLEQALAARRLTKGQLAALVGVSPSSVTKWSKGGQAPEAGTFDRLASVLNVQAEWLTRPILRPVSPPLYRKNASALKAGLAMLGARAEWGQEVAVCLADYVDFPELNLPLRQFTAPEQISNAEIESAAEECRSAWQLGRGPVQDLMLAAEGAGIIVVREETDIPVVEGLSCWSDELGQRPLVHLSADKANGFRSRFDLAHEIGHLILHRHISRTAADADPEAREQAREQYNLMERQAHKFAGAFLLPAQSFASEVRLPVSLDNLLILKQRWGVSVAAMVMRLHVLGLVSDEERLALIKRRSARWGAKSEPGDERWAPEQPRLLRRTIDLLVQEGIVPMDRIPAWLGLSAHDVIQLCGLPPSYFAGSGQVIELATLRVGRASGEAIASSVGGGANIVSLNSTDWRQRS